MSIKDYLSFIGQKIEQAGEKGDKAEAIRLMTLAIETLREEVRKLQP